MRRFTQSGRRRTLARSNKSFCRNRSSDRSFLHFFFATWIHRRGNQEVLISELRSPFFFFFLQVRSLGSKQSTFFDDHKMKREHLAERNIIRLAFIGILRRNFKLIVATIFSDYRTGRTSIILSLLISLKMLARCCLRIASHGGTGLNIKCLEISVALFCLILQST